MIQTALFAAAVFLVFYIPGSLLYMFSGLDVHGALSRSAIRLGIGLVVMPILYAGMRRMEFSDQLMLAIMLALAGYWLYRRRSIPRNKRLANDTMSLIIGILIVGILLSFSHFADFRVADVGAYYRTTALSESTFHLGLVNAMKESFPPPAIYAAGSTDFSYYHLNMHLQMEALHRLTGIDTNRLVFWYFPFLYFLLIFLLPFGFVRDQGGDRFPAIAAGVVAFGSGFSFLPGILGMADPSFAWIQFFHPAVFGIYTLNGLLPALIALFIVLIAISMAPRKQPLGFWLVLGLVIYGSFGLKSSMGLQISSVLLAVGILKYAFESNGARDWKLAACGAVTLAVMLIDQDLIRSDMGKVFVEVRPWHALNFMLSRVGLEEVRSISKPALFVLIFLLSLGVRLAGLFTLKKSLQLNPEMRWLAVFVLIFLLSGYVLPEILYLGDSSYRFNHTDWFAVQGLFASWFLVYLLLARVDSTRWTNRLAISLMVILALPSTFQLLWLKADSPMAFIGPDEQDVVDYLQTTHPSAVVLHPLNQGIPSLASNLAGRSSVLNTHMSFVNEAQGLEQRAIGTITFFSPETDPETRTAIMDFYGVTHVYGPRSLDRMLKLQDDLERVFTNDHYSVWAVDY